MKNKKILLLTSLALISSLSGCGDSPVSSSSNPSSFNSSSSNETSSSSSSSSEVSSSSSSSSSESIIEETSYSINVTSNDDVTISTDKQTAKKGETVTITVIVTNEKKILKEVKANSLNVSKVDDTHYSFVMEESDVTISVILEDKPLENKSITVIADENIVSYTLKVNDQEVTQAKEGEVVTLTATLNNKYILSSVTSTDDIEFSDIENNTVTFTMIDKAITINLTSTYVSQTFKIKSFYSISPIISSIEGVTINEEIEEGTEKNIEISVKTSFTQYYDFKFDVNYHTYLLSLDAEKSTNTVSYYNGTFIMPSDNDASIVVYPALKAATESSKIKINIECDDEQVKVLGVENNQEVKKTPSSVFASYLSENYVTFSVMPKEGYYFDYKTDIKFRTSYESTVTYVKETNLFYFYASSTEATIKITSHAIDGKNTVSFGNNENFEVNGGLSQEFAPGTPVSLKFNSTNGYLIKGDPTIKSLTSGKNFYSSDVNYDATNSALYFIMPSCDVEFTFTLEIPTTFNVIENELIEDYYITSDSSGENRMESGFVDDTFYLFATPKDGYYIKNIYINDETKLTYSSWAKNYSGKIEQKRSHTNKITFDVKKYTQISYDESEAYTISLSKTSAKIEESVTATIKENLGYHVKKVTLVGINNDTVTELTTYNGYSYSFKAPDYDAKINVEYEQVNTYTLSFEQVDGIKSISVLNMFGNRVNSGDTINEGAKLTMTVSLENGYSINSVKVNDTEITLSSSKYEFYMPSSNATINFDLHQAQKHNIGFDFGEENITPKIYDLTESTSWSKKEVTDGKVLEGHQVQIDFTANSYYKQIDIETAKILTASEKEVTYTSIAISIKFIMPSEDINVSCSTKDNVSLRDMYLDDTASSNLIIKDTTKGNEIITSKFIVGDSLLFTLNDADYENYSYKLVIYDKPFDDETKNVLVDFTFYSTSTSTSYSSYSAIYVSLIITAK